MVSRTRYHLKQHHKFEQSDRKYVADLETGDIVEINDVEWRSCPIMHRRRGINS